MEDGSDGVDRLIAEQTAGGLNVQALQSALMACIYCRIVGPSAGAEPRTLAVGNGSTARGWRTESCRARSGRCPRKAQGGRPASCGS